MNVKSKWWLPLCWAGYHPLRLLKQFRLSPQGRRRQAMVCDRCNKRWIMMPLPEGIPPTRYDLLTPKDIRVLEKVYGLPKGSL